jgi:hypothetical protein
MMLLGIGGISGFVSAFGLLMAGCVRATGYLTLGVPSLIIFTSALLGAHAETNKLKLQLARVPRTRHYATERRTGTSPC